METDIYIDPKSWETAASGGGLGGLLYCCAGRDRFALQRQHEPHKISECTRCFNECFMSAPGDGNCALLVLQRLIFGAELVMANGGNIVN